MVNSTHLDLSACPVAGECRNDAAGCISHSAPALCAAIHAAIGKEVAAVLARLGAEEDALWNRCFGNNSPKDPKTKEALIVRLASMRAALSILTRPD